MMLASNLPSVLAIAAGIVVAWRYLRSSSRALPFPPGPRRMPILGNLFNIPTGIQWLAFDKLANKYGDVIYMEVLCQPIVVLNSLDAAVELLERRSAATSSRPRMVMVNELMGFDWMIATIPYGDRWRAVRRLFHSSFHQGVIGQWETIQIRETYKFLRQLLSSPERFEAHIQRFFGAAIMDIIYGISVKEDEDEYVANAEAAIDYLNQASVPGAFLVDSIPLLKHVPIWAPGANFQRTAAGCRRVLEAMINKPFEVVKSSLMRGDESQCVAAQMLQASTSSDDSLLRHTAAAAYLGGAETTSSSVASFLLAMAMNPEVQTKAQAEIDAVTGPDRLPDFSDRTNLPFVNAIVSEVLRWQPVAPLAFPHYTVADEEYRGFLIPAGTVILANAWAILHDPQEYPDPDLFNPERFVINKSDGTLAPNTKIRDPRVAAFGFGRRKCPGRHLAEESLFAVVASVLAVYRILPAVDKNGKDIPLGVGMKPGVVCHPMPFECRIKPRSERAELLVRHSNTV